MKEGAAEEDGTRLDPDERRRLAELAELFERQFEELCDGGGSGSSKGGGRRGDDEDFGEIDDNGVNRHVEESLDALRDLAELFERDFMAASIEESAGFYGGDLDHAAETGKCREKGARASPQQGQTEESSAVLHFMGAISHDIVRIRGQSRTRRGVASRKIKSGECVLFEEPIVTVRAGQGLPNDAPPCDEVEWIVCHGLLEMGCRSGWAREYCAERLSDREENDDVVAWLRDSTGASTEDVVQVYRVVTNNALSLETMCMRITYGAAFYAKAAFINHSCESNCLSLRMGGNMAMYAQRDIEKGEEITHSYVASHLLMQDKKRRSRHLHFACECSRCIGEDDDEFAALSSMHFPGIFASTPDGLSVARFMASVVEGGDESIWSAGVSLLGADHSCGKHLAAELGKYPLASVELLDSWLQSLWGMLLSGGDAESGALRRAGEMWLASARRLAERVSSAFKGARGEASARHLVSTAVVVAYVLGSVDDDECAEAMSSLGEMYGGGLECFREDVSCVAGMPRGGLRDLGGVALKAAALLSTRKLLPLGGRPGRGC